MRIILLLASFQIALSTSSWAQTLNGETTVAPGVTSRMVFFRQDHQPLTAQQNVAVSKLIGDCSDKANKELNIDEKANVQFATSFRAAVYIHECIDGFLSAARNTNSILDGLWWESVTTRKF
jgi:hypothetical protein